MADTAISGSDAVKRSIKSPDGGSEGPSSSKKKKESIDDATKDKPQSRSDVKESTAEVDKTSQTDQSVNTLKRSLDDVDVQCLSPSKRRKFASTQGEPNEILDKDQQGNEEVEKRKKRIKNRALLKAIMEQMEFYFSDSNLSKDRYLRKLFDGTKDGYIDLELFKNFNKLQSLLKGETSLNVMSKALKKSKLLELNEDRTKVRRCTPFKELDPEEVDRRTVYVEHLPSHASHAWIRKIFSPCGKVCYVSLPVYQSTKDIKGFAFVEFGSAEEAEKACSLLNNPPPTKPEEKPGKFPKGNKFLYRAQKLVPSTKNDEGDSNEENLQSDSKEDQSISPTKKKKKKNTKKKTEESVGKSSNSEPTDSQEERKKKKKKKKKQTPVAAVEDERKNDTKDTESSKIEADNKGVGSSEKAEKVQQEKREKSEKDSGISNEQSETKKKKKRKKQKKSQQIDFSEVDMPQELITESTKAIEPEKAHGVDLEESAMDSEVKLSRKERKRLRQEDIRRKKAERGISVTKNSGEGEKEVEMGCVSKEAETKQEVTGSRKRFDSIVSESSETDDSSKIYRKSDGSQLTSCLSKSKKQDVIKKVEFDPVPVTTEFIERKEVRRRKKQKRESLHLRVLSKKEWLSLREEYISKQKSHMASLKESLRELRQQEGCIQPTQENNGKKHVDLTNVFGTKRMKPSQDIKMAHLEELKFIPNVIVQWKCSHQINRNKIKNMFKEIPSDKIAYIEGKEEAESGYIRFKDEASAEEFARLSRSSDSFSARVLPESQQAAYWEKANNDRVAKLSRKKNERGTERIARKVFEKNKATFHEKGSHIVFDNDEDGDDEKKAPSKLDAYANENQQDLEESFLAIFRK